MSKLSCLTKVTLLQIPLKAVKLVVALVLVLALTQALALEIPEKKFMCL